MSDRIAQEYAARAKRRYEKFLISVAQNMASDAKAALRQFNRLDTE
jgi:hypothetical protein